MTGTPLRCLHSTHEPIPAVAVGTPGLALLPPSVPVSALPSALTAALLSQAHRKPEELDIYRAMGRANAAYLPRDERAHGAGAPTRAATFPGTGLPPRRWLPEVDVSVMEVG
jgi:hypothetical protein